MIRIPVTTWTLRVGQTWRSKRSSVQLRIFAVARPIGPNSAVTFAVCPEASVRCVGGPLSYGWLEVSLRLYYTLEQP